MTWSGKRYGSLAHGDGTLIWTRGDGKSSGLGRMERGKKRGQWIERWGDGEATGSYVDGKRRGFGSRGGITETNKGANMWRGKKKADG